MADRRRETAAAAGLLFLRLGMGAAMASHGWGKFEKVLAGELDQFADPIGIGVGPSLVLAAGAEFVGALLVMAGLCTRVSALSVAFTMAVAAFVVHGSDPWSMGEGARLFLAGEAKSWSSKEPALLFLVPFLSLVLTGAGPWSLDALLWPRWRAWRARRRGEAPA